MGDTGPGMAPEVVEKVFDPFFTTKPVGKGTGLGLTVVSTLIAEMGGSIVLDSTPGEGTKFTIHLPLVEAPDLETQARREIRGGRERILVIDDEVDIVSVYRRLLMRLGYLVEAYTDPKTALRAFRADPARIDLVVSDLVMPDLNGEMLAREIWDIRGDCPVIICTAYRTRSLREWRRGALKVLDKPVDPASLAEAIREMLDAPAEDGPEA
ncbi:MAG: response regulator [Hyphomicrobiales bacterium]